MAKLPVDLITANIAHEILARVERAEEGAREHSNTPEELASNLKSMRKDAADSFARNLLYNVAERGSDGAVRKALAALGCPAEEDEIWSRLEAAREAQKREQNETTVS